MDSVKGFLDRVLKFFDVGRVHLYMTKPHPSLKFHWRHGKSVEIDTQQSIAHRSVSDFQHGIVFSDRCVGSEEPVCLKVLKRNSEWTGPLCFGFTTVNPGLLRTEELERARILKCRYPRSFWFHGIISDDCSFITFVMKYNGDVVYRIDDEEEYTIPWEDVGLNPSQELWAVIDVYGSFTSVQLIYHPLLMKRNSIDGISDTASVSSASLMSDTSSLMELSDSESEDLPEPIRRSPPRRFTFDFDFTANNSGTDVSRLQQQFLRLPTSSFFAIASPSPNPCDYSSPAASPMVNICVICQENHANHAFKDCGHMCVCTECSLNYVDSDDETCTFCPTCRQKHSGVLRIY